MQKTADLSKHSRFQVSAILLKILLLLTTAIAVTAVIGFEPMESGRQVLRGVGIMGLPIAVFLVAEGYYRTGSRARYAGRLFIGALIAQLPMHFLLILEQAQNQHLNEDFVNFSDDEKVKFLLKWQELPVLNYLFTLLLALLFIWLIDVAYKKFTSYRTNMPVKMIFGALLVLILIIGVGVAALANGIKFLYAPVLAVMLAFPCVLFRDRREIQCFLFASIGGLSGVLIGPENGRAFYAIGCALPALLLRFYNEKLGYDKESHPYLKYGFYLVYAALLSTIDIIGMKIFVGKYGL